MRRRGSIILAAAMTLCLVGCAAEMPQAQYDACSYHASWVSADSPADDLERLATVLDATIEDMPTGTVGSAISSFVASIQGDSGSVTDASERVTTACNEAGWSPPEGAETAMRPMASRTLTAAARA